MEKEKEIPLYTKIGWIVAWATMAIIVVMILKNCVGSVIYGRKTGQEAMVQFHDTGVADGRAGTPANMSDPGFENPVLRKAYNKGYREGMDDVRVGAEKKE